MTIYDLKPAFQNFLRPIVKLLNRLKITPNQITIYTCCLSLSYSALIYFHPNPKLLYSLPFFFLIRMAFNAIDGMLAKEFNQKTKLGTILNEATDILADMILYAVFFKFSFLNSLFLFIIITISVLTEVIGLSALHLDKARSFDGPMGKSDRAVAFSILGILIAFNISSEAFFIGYFLVILILLIKTCFNRTSRALST